MYAIPTLHVNGTPASVVNQVIGGGVSTPGGGYQSRYQGPIKYIPSKTGSQANVIIPQATMIGRIFVPTPLVGATTVDVHLIDDSSTGWTGGN